MLPLLMGYGPVNCDVQKFPHPSIINWALKDLVDKDEVFTSLLQYLYCFSFVKNNFSKMHCFYFSITEMTSRF